MTLDVEQLISDIKSTASGIITKDVTTLRGFSNRQLQGIANQAALVATGIASGDFTDGQKDFFLNQLIELTHNFVNTLVGLIVATVESLWNAVVAVIWKAISTATSIPLPPFKPL